MNIVFDDLERTVNSPTGWGSFKIEIDGRNVTMLEDFEFIGAYVLTDIKDIMSAILELKKGEDDRVTVNLNGSVFEMEFAILTGDLVKISTRIMEENGVKNSNEGEVELDEFCRELVRTVEEMERLRQPDQDDLPARWEGIGQSVKNKKDELRSLVGD